MKSYKLKDGIILTEADGVYVAVDAATDEQRFNGMIRLNETAAFILRHMTEKTTDDAILDALCAEYDVARDTAAENVRRVTDALAANGLLEVYDD